MVRGIAGQSEKKNFFSFFFSFIFRSFFFSFRVFSSFFGVDRKSKNKKRIAELIRKKKKADGDDVYIQPPSSKHLDCLKYSNNEKIGMVTMCKSITKKRERERDRKF
jgi:hypothetical protein